MFDVTLQAAGKHALSDGNGDSSVKYRLAILATLTVSDLRSKLRKEDHDR